MKSQILHTVWCNISGETAGEFEIYHSWKWKVDLERSVRHLTENVKDESLKLSSAGLAEVILSLVFPTPRKYVFDVTSVGQCSSPWTCKLSESRDKFHLECKLHFPSAQLILRQMHLTTVSASIEVKYWVSWLVLMLTSVKTSYQNWLEFVILCSNRWLKVEVSARQKSVFTRCLSTYLKPNFRAIFRRRKCQPPLLSLL